MSLNKVKISTLAKDTIVLVDQNSEISTVADILEDLEFYKGKKVYTTTQRQAFFNAKDIIESAIEDEYQNMYEDWDENISGDVTEEDAADLQKIFNRILARSPQQNISYEAKELIEIDIEKIESSLKNESEEK